MNEFIYSLNATLPVFFVMVLGYLLMQRGFLNESFNAVGNKLVFHIALPTMLFKNVYDTDLATAVNPRFLGFCVVGTLAIFGGVWLLCALTVRDKTILGSLIQGSSRGNVALLGVVFIQNMYGDAGPAAIMVAIVVPMINVLSVILLSVYDSSAGAESRKAVLKTACFNVCKNPLILSILLGFAVSGLGISLPVIATKTISSVAALATPLSLLVLGAGFGGREALSRAKPTAMATVIKLIVIPAVLLPVAVGMGFRGQELATLLIMAGAPTAVSSYIMAKSMHNDAALASSVVAATTLFASVSLTFWIFLLKTLGYL